MRRISLGATGAMMALFGGLVVFGGQHLIAAAPSRPEPANPNAVISNSRANRAGPRTAVRVKATGEPVKANGLVVPLKPRRATAGELSALNKAGKPIGQCPLQHTDVAADVAGFVARVTVTQKYANPFNEPIEAVYTFPLPEDAAVDDMEMRIGTRVIKGEIKRREEARQVYEAAKAAGQAAALLDQERPNIFTQSVANVMPGQDVTITIRYVNTLKYDEGKYQFAFPMVVGPRFIPGGGGYREPGKRGDPSPKKDVPANPGKTPVVTDAEKITPPITPPGTRSGHDISLSVNLDAGLILQDVASLSHDIDVTRDGETKAAVKLVNDATIPNKDFILRYTVAGPQMQTGVIAHADGGTGYFTLVLQPPAAPQRAIIAPKEMVFVIDQTGSQMGQPIAKSKETMKYAIRHLNPGDTFQLIGFNTDVYPCFERPVPATPANIQKAIAYLDPLEGAGGTDILKAADYALKMPDDPNRLRIICFMTDGYVGNDMQILDYVRNNRGRARMFPFGIGGSVNRFLIEGMAREGRGEAEIVTLDEDGAAAAERFNRRVQNPVLLNPEVDFHGLPVEDVYPKSIPDVFSEGPIIVKGRFTRAAEGDITVRGLLGGQPWEERVHVTFPAERAEGAGLESLWARARLEDLQAQDWIGAQTGKPNTEIKEQIVQTALEHRLMSQYTSFVAVEKKVVNQGGQQRTVDVPVEMPEGVAYEGIFMDSDVAAARPAAGAVMLYSASPAGVAKGKIAGRTVLSEMAARSGSNLGAVLTPNPPGPALAPPPPPAPPVAPRRDQNIPVQPVPKDQKWLVRDAQQVLDLAAGKAEAYSKLAKLPAAERVALLRQAKLDLSLWNLARIVQREGKAGTLRRPDRPAVEKGKVKITVTLNSAQTKDSRARLRALGFEETSSLSNTFTGTLPVAKLDALIALRFVRHVAPAKG